jgi:hypothetical protein
LNGLLDVLGSTKDLFQLGLVNNGFGVADEIGKLGTERSIKGGGGSPCDNIGNDKVCESNSFANEESTGGEVLIDGLKRTCLALDEGVVNLELFDPRFELRKYTSRKGATHGFVIGSDSTLNKLNNQ